MKLGQITHGLRTNTDDNYKRLVCHSEFYSGNEDRMKRLEQYFDRDMIFENAIASLDMGIKDYKEGDTRRVISAVRNFYSGVLLLGKHCLLNAAPNANPFDVLGAKFEPRTDDNGGVIISALNSKTIDLNEMRSRFKAFNLDWPKANIERLQIIRNNIEHFHSVESSESMQQVIAECFPMVEKFFVILNLHPFEHLKNAWTVMLEEKTFFSAKKKECDQTFNELRWLKPKLKFDIACQECGLTLLYQKDPKNSDPSSCEIACKSCGEEMLPETFIEHVVESEYGADDYASAKDGDTSVINICPECGSDAYVESSEVQGCFCCNYTIPSECVGCGDALGINNLADESSDLCSYCDCRFNKDE